MGEDGGSRRNLEDVYNVESILECMNFCGVEKVFLFAPMLDRQRCIDTLLSAVLMYGTDTFWPMDPETSAAVTKPPYLRRRLEGFEVLRSHIRANWHNARCRPSYESRCVLRAICVLWEIAQVHKITQTGTVVRLGEW